MLLARPWEPSLHAGAPLLDGCMCCPPALTPAWLAAGGGGGRTLADEFDDDDLERMQHEAHWVSVQLAGTWPGIRLVTDNASRAGRP